MTKLFVVEGKYHIDNSSSARHNYYRSAVQFPDYGYGVFTSREAAKAMIARYSDEDGYPNTQDCGLHGNDLLVSFHIKTQHVS